MKFRLRFVRLWLTTSRGWCKIFLQLERFKKHMNKKTRQFAVQVSSPGHSEAVQRIAFSFGYGWPMDGKNIIHTNAKFLVFDPEGMLIFWANLKSELMNVEIVISTFEEVIKLFNNPPKSVLSVGNMNVWENGDVEFPFAGRLTSDGFDTVVREREKFIGRTIKKNLPLVSFSYKSKSSGVKNRYIAVTTVDPEWIGGLDQDDEWKYKKFLRNSILSEIVFSGFVPEP